MSTYTHVNLNNVENQAPNFGLPEEVEARFATGELELKEYDAIRVPAGVMRNFEAGPEGIEYVAFGGPFVEDKQAEAELQPGWWQD